MKNFSSLNNYEQEHSLDQVFGFSESFPVLKILKKLKKSLTVS